MALREVAVFEGPVIGARIRPCNPDASTALVKRQVSKVGPFDFSGAATIAAVTITVKTDTGAIVSDTIDLSTAADDAAVTVAELVAAITTAAVTNLTATVEGSGASARAKLSLSTPGTAVYVQIGGEVAQFAGFGYGYGTGFKKITTQGSIAQEVTNRDSERLEAVGSDGLITAILTRGYRQGSTITLTDTARDIDLRAMLEGGTFVDDGYDNLRYQAPGVSSTRPNVDIEWFSGLYADGDSNEDNMVGVLWRRCKSAKLTTVGGTAGDRNIQNGVYTMGITPYKAVTASLALTPPDTNETDTREQVLTIAEWESLNWKAV